MKKLQVLVIDDSAYNRQTIAEILNAHPEIEVVAKASDGEEGLKLALRLRPDLITLDIEMPRMDGFTFLRLLMSKQPTPVIVISSHNRKHEVFKALELGALDFIAKPSHHLGPDLGRIRDELLAKALTVKALEMRSFRERSLGRTEPNETEPRHSAVSETSGEMRVERLVCIGASTGGPPALESIFRALSSSPTTAFMVAQHMPEKFTRAFAERLNRIAAVQIAEGEDIMAVSGGHAYVAPGGSHMELVEEPAGQFFVRLCACTTEDRYVPSIDRLFRSAAKTSIGSKLAVVLTGMGADGAEGIRAFRAAGGHTWAESQETAIVFGMPNEAIRTGCVDEVLSLPQLAERINLFAATHETA